LQQRNSDALRQRLTAVLKTLPSRNDLPGDVAGEIEIRRGLLQYRLGDQEAALGSLTRGLATALDQSARYWGLLFRGRVLEATGRPAEGLRQFDEAVNLAWPRSQTAAIALAAAHLMAGDRAEADAWARIARSLPAGDDPWWEYWYGDQRFWAALRAEIRSGVR
jgi:hypothetical protein